MSKDLNKATAEQAGGDERAAFEAWLAQAVSHQFVPELELAKYEESGEYRYNPAADYWKAWQARAALAQPSPVSEALIYACKNLAQITSSDGSGHADIAMAVLRMAGVGDDERERLVNEWKAARAWKPSPAQAEGAPVVGCLCGMPMTEGHHSPDGCCNLEEFAPNTAQSQAEGFTHFPELLESVQQMDAMLKAEAERPEVVAYFDRNYPSTGDAFIWSNYEGSPYEPVMTVAQHGRIVAQLHDALDESDGDRWKLRSERDAALARVEQQERTIAGMNEAHAKLAGLYEAAQAQHSVPEGWRIERSAERIVVMNLNNGAGYAAARDGESGIAESVLYLLAADLLAAAPGKEVGHE
ncbi:hypothetical protein HT115_04835 [Pseudomonas aeruginosa]|uniref:hypothetical protein n=1 Tax=Pseudomonas aeruginosa TaxID=287 RepID=UPI001572A99B|nr:hypothetical protein [Pseudomonas aeruginosa]NTS91627.1 hypothetical protein [Pseudomonas aeruginosa]